MTRTESITVHVRVTIGIAHSEVRDPAVFVGGGRGTLSSFMSVSIFGLSTMMMSSTTTAVRAGWAFALAMVALWIVDKLKPATPRKPIPVRVDQKPTPLYQEPERQQRRHALFRLSGMAVLLGALLACLIGFASAVVLEILGGLVGN